MGVTGVITNCPYCKKRAPIINDLEFYGCQECWDIKISPEFKAKIRQCLIEEKK